MPLYAPAVTALADRLAARTLELVDIPSESGNEAAIREHLLEPRAAGLDAPSTPGTRRSSSCRPGEPDIPLVVLAAHYDTVPAQGNLPGRIVDGAVHGLGASDMKGGLAVAIELARDVDLESATVRPRASALRARGAPGRAQPASSAVRRLDAPSTTRRSRSFSSRPTCEIQSGCLGNVVARLTFHGTSGHSARPWLADSALERAVRGLGPLFELEPRVAVVGGLEFREVVSVTRLQAGIADNVIPGEATAT